MSQSRPLATIDTEQFRNGLILHARTSGLFGRSIRWALGRAAKRQGLPKPFGNHDALLWHESGQWWVLDAEPPVAHLTPWHVWAERVRQGKAQVRFYWPAGAMRMDGNVAVKWWLENVRNAPYDRTAFARLLYRAIIGPRWKSQAGKDHAWWCTEGVRGGWVFAGFDPTGKNNSTPLDMEAGVLSGRLDDWTGGVFRLGA